MNGSMRATSRMRLVPKELLVKTSAIDHADWNYRGSCRLIQRQRFRLILDLMGDRQFARLLEIGYGSGVFMPELGLRCDSLHGIDIHSRGPEVSRSLQSVGTTAELVRGSAARLPYDTGFFDAVVAVSSLEFIDDFEAACREIRRVLSPDGRLFAVVPGHSWLLDLGLKILTGESAKADYGDRREAVPRTLQRHFSVATRRGYPARTPGVCRLYSSYELEPLA